VGALRNNGIGTIGTAPGVKIMPIQWGTTFADVAQAIDLAVQHGAKVLSNSWGWVGSPSAVVASAIDDALRAGRTVLFAAGNGPDRSPWTYDTVFPCNLTATTDVICVGASSPTDEHKNASSSDGLFYWGSSYLGAGPDVVAPGPWSYTTDRLGALGYNENVNLTGIDVDYTHDFGGTSSSTPKVAGIAALMLSKNPSLTPGQVKSILRSTSVDIDVPGVDDRTGAGRVDALAAVGAIPRFNDVPTSYWAWPHIEAIAIAGITKGCGPNLYCPTNPVSRAEMAAFLLRGIHGGGYTPPAPTGNRFSDVPASYWAAGWIEQLAAEGITLGCGGGRYCPEGPVTRAEMALFLLRSKYGGNYQPPPATGTRFGDVPQNYWAAGWIEQLAAEGITTGCGGGNYCPENSVIRAEMAAFLARTFNLTLPPRP
jgi:subtilisin family serine protease